MLGKPCVFVEALQGNRVVENYTTQAEKQIKEDYRKTKDKNKMSGVRVELTTFGCPLVTSSHKSI